MNKSIWVLGEALMDCIAQPDGTLKPLIGGSPYNLARAAALRGADVSFVNPLSTDNFGDQMRAQLAQDGVKPLLEFTSLVAQCDLLVTSVTMALHLAIAFEKKIILMNNIFPTNEFHLYGLGKIIEPQLGCKYCFKSSFDSNCETTSCMGLISPSQIQSEIRRSFPLFGSLIS